MMSGTMSPNRAQTIFTGAFRGCRLATGNSLKPKARTQVVEIEAANRVTYPVRLNELGENDRITPQHRGVSELQASNASVVGLRNDDLLRGPNLEKEYQGC